MIDQRDRVMAEPCLGGCRCPTWSVSGRWRSGARVLEDYSRKSPSDLEIVTANSEDAAAFDRS